jgi:hypothetical protein
MTDDRSGLLVEPRPDVCEIRRSCETQGPGEGSSTLGQLEATPSVMEPGAAPRERPADVDDEPGLWGVGLVHHEAEKNRPQVTLPAPDARSNRRVSARGIV